MLTHQAQYPVPGGPLPRRRNRAQTLHQGPIKTFAMEGAQEHEPSARTARIAATRSASGMGPAGPGRLAVLSTGGWRCLYRVALETCQETRMKTGRQTRAVPWGLPLEGETETLIAAASGGPKGKDGLFRVMGLQQGDLGLQQLPLQQHHVKTSALSLSPCTASPSMGRVERLASPVAKKASRQVQSVAAVTPSERETNS